MSELSTLGSVIKTAYEGQPNTNAFTDAEKNKLGNLTKSDVGLGNVDNTSDLNKPISTATQTALNAKAPTASPTFTGTVSGITKSMVGLGNVDNTADSAKPISTATQTALNLRPTSDITGITGADAITNIVSLLQAEYDAIPVKSATTLYVITDA